MDIAEMNTVKGALARYFDVAHDALLWKIDGLSDYDLRRPLTPTGTNLLGIIKHCAFVELGYFGHVFGRPASFEVPTRDDDPFADMYASADETTADIIELFRAAWAHAKETIEALDLDSEGHVPWWEPGGNPVTLQRILVHMIAELHRHLGQVDILRESIDGSAGMREDAPNLPAEGEHDWVAYCARLQAIAEQA